MFNLERKRAGLRRLFALLLFDSIYLVIERRYRVYSAAAQLAGFLPSLDRAGRVAALKRDVSERGQGRAIGVGACRRLNLTKKRFCLIEMIKFQIRSRQRKHNSLSALVVDDGVLEIGDCLLEVAVLVCIESPLTAGIGISSFGCFNRTVCLDLAHTSASLLILGEQLADLLELFDGGFDVASRIGLVARCRKRFFHLIANLACLFVLAIYRERLSGVIVSTCSSRLGEAARLQRFVCLTQQLTHFP